MAQTLKFGNGTWATKKGSTLAFNDQDGNFKPLPFTTTRATGATRVNKEGLIEVVESDRPRIDYTDSADGVLLLEKAATNLVTHSEDFSNAAWVKLGAGTGSAAIVTSDYAISPDGTQNATRLQCDLNGGLTSSANQSLIYDSYTSSGNQSISIYVKSNTGSNQTIYFANTQTSGDTITVTSDWQRFEFSHSTATYIVAIGLRGRSGGSIDDTADILIWGAQSESGNLSSYIPTQGSAVTRVADTASGSGNSEVFNDSEGVLFANIAANANDLSNRILSLSNGAYSNSTRISYNTTSNSIEYRVVSSSSIQAQLIYALPDIKTNNKISVKYKSNDFALWINGFKVATDLSGLTSIGLDRLNFDDGGGAADFYGKTKEIGYYDTTLTDAELETLTSYRSLSELVTELNLNTL